MIREWDRFLAVCDNRASKYYYDPQKNKIDIYKYWIKLRGEFPNVALVMLWWLSFPIGTAGLERDFSGLTMVTRAFRRNRMKKDNFVSTVLTHCFKTELEQLLRLHLRRSS